MSQLNSVEMSRRILSVGPQRSPAECAGFIGFTHVFVCDIPNGARVHHIGHGHILHDVVERDGTSGNPFYPEEFSLYLIDIEPNSAAAPIVNSSFHTAKFRFGGVQFASDIDQRPHISNRTMTSEGSLQVFGE